MVEPWLRGTRTGIDPVRRQVLHALDLTAEDAATWTGSLSDDEVHARPFGLASVAFHLRHIARSLDRLLTYAAGDPLSAAQLSALQTEMLPAEPAAAIHAEFHAGLTTAAARILGIDPTSFDRPRTVGRALLPTTIGGLLVHCAEHTQRHAGQMVTTAKLVATVYHGSGTGGDGHPD